MAKKLTQKKVSMRASARPFPDGIGKDGSAKEKGYTEDVSRIYKILFESAAEGLVIVNSNGTIQMINSRTNEMFGYDKEELIGQPLEILLPEKYRDKHVEYRRSYNEHPKRRPMGIGMELNGRRKDGSFFPVEISLNHFEISGEKLSMALISDITERHKSQQHVYKLNEELEQRVQERTRALAESQRLYQVVARNFPDGTINVFDKDLKYVFVEGKELFKYGLTSEKLMGTSYLQRLPAEIREEVKTKLLEVFAGNNSHFEVSFRDRHYLMNAVALPNAEGKVDQILLVEQNVTVQKQAEENVLKALEKERQLNELKSRFVSMASHEFRTPLGTVLSSVALIERYLEQDDLALPEIKEKTDKHVKRIRSAVGSLTSILNDFLSLDKLEQGKIEPKSSVFDIVKFSEDLVEEVQTMVRAGQIIKYEHTGTESEVFLDQQMLKNIILNLLSNASKYSPENSSIEFTTKLDEKELVITIADHGMGIPEDDRQQLFERFFRARNAINIQGTGLGLNIVKRYVDLMKGKVTFASKEKAGTTFKVVIENQNII